MRLLVISHTPHYLRDGGVVGWAATVRELDQLATRFRSVRHIACLHRSPAPSSTQPYAADNVELVAVPPAGGEGLRGKLDALLATPRYIETIARELPNADVVHVRAPANIALVAMLMLAARGRPAARWFKYAGNWSPTSRESPSYTLQRWWLRRSWHHGVVTVNGSWPDQPPWVHAFENPSLDRDAIEHGRRAAATKRLTERLHLVFVGQLTDYKGVGRALEILARVRARSVDATLELVGDGPDRATFEQRAVELGIATAVEFRGWLAPADVQSAYARAHLQLLPTASEGWPKALSEGLAFGVVPVTSAVSSIPQYIARFRSGIALPPHDLDAFVDAIVGYAMAPARWHAESERALAASRTFSFEHYLDAVDHLLAKLGVRAGPGSELV